MVATPTPVQFDPVGPDRKFVSGIMQVGGDLPQATTEIDQRY